MAQLRRFTDGLVDRGIERDDSPNELTSNGLRVRQLATGCRQSRDKLTRDLLRQRSENGSEPPPRLKFADLELDEDSHEVWRAGAQIQLSPTEFKLLRYFMGNANRVLSKMQILDHVWDYDFRGDTGIVESYVSVLRRKVDSAEPHLLHTLRGVGYVLRLPSS